MTLYANQLRACPDCGAVLISHDHGEHTRLFDCACSYSLVVDRGCGPWCNCKRGGDQ